MRPSKAIFASLFVASAIASEATDILPGATDRPLPDNWRYTEGLTQTMPCGDKWWNTFNDSLLDSLIYLAENNNYNLKSALKRMELAAKETSLARSGYSPTFGASAGWTRSQDAGAIQGKGIKSNTSSYFDLGLSASWEIDVFGRVASQVKTAKAGEAVSRADYEAVMVSLCSSLAKSYITLRQYQAQYDVAKEHISSQEIVVKITEARFKAGIGDMLEVTQARLVLSSTEATLPGLENLIQTTANSIAVLCGEYPANLAPRLLITAPLPDMPTVPATGVPADLLRRRPDVLEAEYRIASLAAQIGVAKKDFLPTLSLDGEISTSSRSAGGLFGSHSLGYNIAPTLSWTIFDGNARNIRVAEAKIQMEESIDNYNSTVLNAVSEVENALSKINSSLEEVKQQGITTELSARSLKLSVDLYKRGLTPFSNVVDAQMNYLEYQNSQITARADALAAMITLYQALGGGY